MADEMGLGKTIQLIALIMARESRDEHTSNLIIVPLALIDQWKDEIAAKGSNSIRVLVYHGPKARRQAFNLASYDVVITTYQIIVKEWVDIKAKDADEAAEMQTSSIFTTQWFRVILDEAHTIKNKSTKISRACAALNAEHRWCLTGTLIHNDIDDLYAIFRFLCVKAYSDYSM